MKGRQNGKCGWLLEASKKAPCHPSLELKPVIIQLSTNSDLADSGLSSPAPTVKLRAVKTHKVMVAELGQLFSLSAPLHHYLATVTMAHYQLATINTF